MGFPTFFNATESDRAIELAAAFVRCMRASGRTVNPHPVFKRKDGTYTVIVDTCGNYDAALVERCSDAANNDFTHVDLRDYSPGKVVKLKGAHK